MKILVDGKEISFQNDVKVIYDDVCVDMDIDTKEEKYAELHVCLTNEGMILDLIDDEGVIGTYAQEYGEIATLCR